MSAKKKHLPNDATFVDVKDGIILRKTDVFGAHFWYTTPTGEMCQIVVVFAPISGKIRVSVSPGVLLKPPFKPVPGDIVVTALSIRWHQERFDLKGEKPLTLEDAHHIRDFLLSHLKA